MSSRKKVRRLHNIAVNEKNEGAYQQAIELEEILHGDLEEKAKELEKELHKAFASEPDLHLLGFELWKKREGTWEKPRQGIIELVVQCTHPKSRKSTGLTIEEKRKRRGFQKARAKRIGNVVWEVFKNFTNGFAKVGDMAEVEEVQEEGTIYILDMNYLYHFKLLYGQYDG